MSFIVILGVVAALAGIAYANGPRLLDALTSRTGYSVERDIAYDDLPRRTLDLYRPDFGIDTAPLIVFFYGSAWSNGSKNLYRFVAEPFASRGFVVAVPDYRLFPEVTFPGFVEDGAEAVAHLWRTLRKTDGSARQLILIGHSSGAHLATLLAVDRRYLTAAGVPPDAIAAVVGMSGPYDFLPLTQAKYERIFPAASRAASQPIAFVDGEQAPMLLLTGDADTTVDPGNSARLAERIRKTGGEVLLKAYPGVGHVGMILALASASPFRKPPALADILAFVAAQLQRAASSSSHSGQSKSPVS
jgi:acetyl esterase/lipase